MEPSIINGEKALSVPHSIEAERSAIGSMLVSANAVEICIDALTPDDFYLESHRRIFSAMRSLYNKGIAIDLVTLHDELEKRGQLNEVGDITYLSQLMLGPTPGNISHYTNIIVEKSVMRRLMEAGSSIASNAADGAMASDELLEDAERRIYNITMRAGEDTLLGVRDELNEVFDKISEFMLTKDKLTGVPTGFYDLDKLTSGLQKSDLIIIAGRPSTGKTAFALNIAANAAFEEGKMVAIFSLEMSRGQLLTRMLCSQARVNMQSVLQGTVTSEDIVRIVNAMPQMTHSGLMIDDSANVSVAEIRSRCRRAKAKTGLDLIIIDYLQLMKTTGKRSENRVLEIAELTRSLKVLARELDVPIILLSQLSRAADKVRPTMAHLRESGAIEQDADLIILLYREGMFNPEAGNIAEAIIAKNRNGPTSSIEMVFAGEYTRFENKSLYEE